MSKKGKAAPGTNRAASNQAYHSSNSNATAQKIGNSPYGPDFVQISAEEAKRRMCSGTPGILIVQLRHDGWCKTLKTGHGDDCNCNPDEALWLSEQTGGEK